jgi:tuftelin-interacting protein 11
MSAFRNWKPVLRINHDKPVQENNQVDIYGSRSHAPPPVELYVPFFQFSCALFLPYFRMKPMTPFESLLWNVWLPKVRSAINNEWDASNPQPAVRLYEAWSTFLPPFIRDNMLDQLILPKVQKTVTEWKPKLNKVSLQGIVFPWLPHVGLRLEDVVSDARRKVKSLLRGWVVEEEVPKDLIAWRDVSRLFSSSEYLSHTFFRSSK